MSGRRDGASPRMEQHACSTPTKDSRPCETARGLLLHRARVRDECVVDYQIVAPTEWNFHPEGALVRGLEGSTSDDEPGSLRAARLAVHALDPCVAFRVEVGHA